MVAARPDHSNWPRRHGLAAYAVVSLMESLRIYDPWKEFYEPKDTERERYELLRRAEEMKQQGRP